MITVRFDQAEFNSKLRNLESNGFQEYLSTNEDGVDHVIMTNTKEPHAYSGWVADVYSDGRIEYTSQFKSEVIDENKAHKAAISVKESKSKVG